MGLPTRLNLQARLSSGTVGSGDPTRLNNLQARLSSGTVGSGDPTYKVSRDASNTEFL